MLSFFVCSLLCFLCFGLHCFSSVQSLSRVWLFATPWTTARQASLSITNPPELTQTHVHCVGDAVHESLLHIRRPKYWSFSFSISPSNEYSGLIALVGWWNNVVGIRTFLSIKQTGGEPRLKDGSCQMLLSLCADSSWVLTVGQN